MSDTPPAPRECVLVVDDQAANIQTVGTLLTSMGYDIMAATSAEQALQRMTARAPDLILLDMMMPGVSGLDLCRRLQAKKQWADIPVIFLSAAGETATVTAGLEAGAVDYVTKPFHRAELLLRIRTHLALRSARNQLRSTAAEKEGLLSVLAHDFKNHLAAIQVHADFLKSLPHASPEAAACAETISAESARMANCVNALLDDAGNPVEVPALQAMDAVKASIPVIQAMEVLAGAKRQSLALEAPEQQIEVLADPGALRRILENLLSNAVKFTPVGGTLKLAIVRAAGKVEFSVTDSGPGFTPEDLTNAFTRFTRLSARPTGTESSTGLGLSIVRSLAVAMGGEARIYPGPGGLCVVSLPAPDAGCRAS